MTAVFGMLLAVGCGYCGGMDCSHGYTGWLWWIVGSVSCGTISLYSANVETRHATEDATWEDAHKCYRKKGKP